MRHVQLRAFHQVALTGSFSRAAEALHVTQPAISDQIRKLEEEYDTLLFNRAKRQVTLTWAGTTLLEVTRRLFDAEDQALQLLTENRALQGGTLRIVADSAVHVLRVLAAFRVRYPAVLVQVRSGNSAQVMTSLHAYDADLGVIGEIPDGQTFDHVRLNATAITAFVAAGHPLAGADVLPWASLPDLPLILREQGSKTRTKLEAAALANGVTLTPAIEAEGREAVRELVAAGAGVGFVSGAEFLPDPRLVAVPLEPSPALMMEEALICLRERRGGKMVRAFMDMARQMV
ncbi:MAG: LysR family transcriptional regulator [Candidatus Saccharibacteria bacterium]|nr:LysR family transcriptional regulator [Pseudorhodobacter sp.]